MFVYLFNPATGPINQFLGRSSASTRRSGSSTRRWAKPALVMLGLWGIGDAIVLYLAGLLNVPRDLYEAIAIEGANAWQRFRYVTLPMLTPVIFFTLIIGIIDGFQYFDQAYVSSTHRRRRRRLARRTRCCSTRSGSTSRRSAYFHMGYASAMAWVLFVATMVLTAVLLLTSRRWVHYGGGLS